MTEDCYSIYRQRKLCTLDLILFNDNEIYISSQDRNATWKYTEINSSQWYLKLLLSIPLKNNIKEYLLTNEMSQQNNENNRYDCVVQFQMWKGASLPRSSYGRLYCYHYILWSNWTSLFTMLIKYEYRHLAMEIFYSATLYSNSTYYIYE